MRRRALIAAIVIACLAAANLLAIADAPFIPPSHFYFDDAFSYRLYWSQQRPRIDLAILGNSRTRSGVDPRTLSEALSARLGRRIAAQSLAAVGGFFPFYLEVADELLARPDPPGAILIGLSPRDLDGSDPRREVARETLIRSSAYGLARVPYAAPFRRLEAHAADLTAALAPALTGRSRVAAALTPGVLWPPTDGGRPNALQRLFGLDLATREEAEGAVPVDWATAAKRLASYGTRLGAALDWRPPPGEGGVDPWGGEAPSQAETASERQLRIARLAARWEALQQHELAAWRNDPRCVDRHPLEDGPAAAPERFFRRVAESRVPVFIVLVPAMSLGECEDNLALNRRLVDYLHRLASRYPNIRGVIDLNNGFRHDFMRVEDYDDLEHMVPAAAAEVSQRLAAAIAPLWAPPPRDAIVQDGAQ
jgi:hypothetical protein